jgi:hypothetical protein
MAGTKRRASCRELFKKFNILPLASEILLSLSSSVVNNRKISNKLRYPDLTFMCQTLPLVNIKKEFTILELSYSIIFPPTIKCLNHDIKKFKPALKEYLLSHSFYSVEELTSTKNSQLL